MADRARAFRHLGIVAKADERSDMRAHEARVYREAAAITKEQTTRRVDSPPRSACPLLEKELKECNKLRTTHTDDSREARKRIAEYQANETVLIKARGVCEQAKQGLQRDGGFMKPTPSSDPEPTSDMVAELTRRIHELEDAKRAEKGCPVM